MHKVPPFHSPFYNKSRQTIDKQSNNHQGIRPSRVNTQSWRGSLFRNYEHFLNKITPLPAYTVFLGMCEDGLPLLMDLADPIPGPILISGSTEWQRERVLMSIMASTAALNPVSRAAYCVISPKLGAFDELANSPHCIGFHSSYDRIAGESVIKFAEIAEQRRNGHNPSQAVILAIDDLWALLKYDSYEIDTYFSWLLSYGPISMVWPIATIAEDKLSKINQRILEKFSMHITGYYRENPEPLPGSRLLMGGNNTSSLFTTNIAGEYIRFSVPGFV